MWQTRSGTRVLYRLQRYQAWAPSRRANARMKAATRRESLDQRPTPRPTAYLQAPLSQGGAATAAGMWNARSGTRVLYRLRRYKAWAPSRRANARTKAAEPADKPGSVVNSHSSRRYVTAALKQPTRIQRGPRQWIPIWSCSRWGLPCRSVTGLAVRSYRTISPLPAPRRERRRYLSVALSVGLRRPGVTWHLALWSPDFPRHSCE